MNLKQLLKGRLAPEQISSVKRSFDQIGSIAQLEIPEELVKKEKIISQTVLEQFNNIKTVVKKTDITKGKYRVRPVTVLAGENTTKTLHKENGIRLMLDLNKVFFTPRLSGERLRILNMVKKGEVVADLFCGVGPYSILIAKFSKCKKIIMNDINPTAIKYLKENIKLNKLDEKKCEVYNKDAKKFRLKADHVIMNIPKYSEDFLNVGFTNAKKNGIIHYYCFGTIKELKDIKKTIRDYKPCRILRAVRCGDIGPRIHRWCIDIKKL